MPEISHVRFAVPEQASLNRILREGGAQLFPQWLYAEPGDPRILWWGVRGAPLQMLDVPDDPARAALFPRAIDDWTEAPRGLILATSDAERAAADLAPALGSAWLDAGEDDILGARCQRMTLGRSMLVLAEASGEGAGGSAGYVAACLEGFGEGPVAVALDGTAGAGRQAASNPVSGGPATYVRIGPGTAPMLIFLPVR
jgi:hypothetical protein